MGKKSAGPRARLLDARGAGDEGSVEQEGAQQLWRGEERERWGDGAVVGGGGVTSLLLSFSWCVHPILNSMVYASKHDLVFFISSNSIHQFHLHPNKNIGIKPNAKASQIWHLAQFNTKPFNVYIQMEP